MSTTTTLERSDAAKQKRLERRELSEANGWVYPGAITHGKSGWFNYFCRCDVCDMGHRDGVTKQKADATAEDKAAMAAVIASTHALRRERFVAALTRITLASDTDAVGIEVDTDDLAACEQWLDERPMATAVGLAVGGHEARFARVAVSSAITAGDGKRSTRYAATIPGRELSGYVRLLHDVHAVAGASKQST